MAFFFYKEVIVLLEKSSNIYDSTCSVFREKKSKPFPYINLFAVPISM